MIRLFRRQVAVPADHGSWVFLLSPLLIGLFAGGRLSAVSAYVVMAALCAFLIRQPVTVAIKVISGRRPRSELPAAAAWIAIYTVVGLLHVAGLVWRGFGYLLYLALPMLPILSWYLALVARRAERQLGIELIGSGVLALSAPAAYWVGVGEPDPRGWWLWVLTWLQGAASILHVHMRLRQREPVARAARGRYREPALLVASFNLTAVLTLSALAILPALLALPFAAQWLETVRGAGWAAPPAQPRRIGLRQLAVSALFTALFILVWRD